MHKNDEKKCMGRQSKKIKNMLSSHMQHFNPNSFRSAAAVRFNAQQTRLRCGQRTEISGAVGTANKTFLSETSLVRGLHNSNQILLWLKTNNIKHEL